QILERLLDNLDALEHLLHADLVAGIAVALGGADDLEIEILVGEIGLVFAQIADDAAAAGDRARAAEADRILFREDADIPRALDEDAVAIEKFTDVGVSFREVGDELAQLGDKVVVDVEEQAADARVARMKPLPRGGLEDVVEKLALIEGVEKRGESTEVDSGGPDTQKMIADPAQFVEQRPQILAARRQLDAHQLLDRPVPGDLVADRRDVVHPVDDRDVLVEIEILAEFFEAGVEKTDVRHRLDDGLAVEGENEAQGRMRGRMLWAEIERPEVLLVLCLAGAGL